MTRRRLERDLQTILVPPTPDSPPDRLIPTFDSVSNLLERSEARYQLSSTDPDDDTRPDSPGISHLLDILASSSDVLEELSRIVTNSATTPPTLDSAIRAVSAWCAVSEFPRDSVDEDVEDSLVECLARLVRDESAPHRPSTVLPSDPPPPTPRRVYATAVLAHLAEDSDIASTAVRAGICEACVGRLREYYPVVGRLFLPEPSFVGGFPTAASLGSFSHAPARPMALPASPSQSPSPPASPGMPPARVVTEPGNLAEETAETPMTAPDAGGLRLHVEREEDQRHEEREEGEDEDGRESVSSEQSNEGEVIEDVKTDAIPADTLRRLEVRALLQLMATIGEYQEIVAPMFQERGFEVVLALLKARNYYLLLDALRLVGQLLAHKKFGSAFVERAGLQLFFTAPHTPFLSGALGSCFAGLAANVSIIEQICLLTNPYPTSLMKQALWLMTATPTARKMAASFLSTALSFRTLLEIFEPLNGLSAVVAALKDAHASKNKHLSLTVVFCLRQYLRTRHILVSHLMQLDTFESASNPPEHSLAALREAPPPIPSYKAIDTDERSVSEASRVIEERRKSHGSMRIRWPHFESMKSGGIATLLDTFASTLDTMGGRALNEDIEQYVMESLHVITSVPATHRYILDFTTTRESEDDEEPTKTGVQLILAAAAKEQRPDILRAALNVICNLVARVPIPLAATATATAPVAAPAPVPALPQPPSTPPPAHPAVSTSPWKSPLAQTRKETGDDVLRRFWKEMRSNNGIKCLLLLLTYQGPTTVEESEEVRALSCKALAGMARDATINQILGKLQVGSVLSDVMKEERQQQQPPSAAFEFHHAEFCRHSVDLISRVTGQLPSSAILARQVSDSTHKKLERAAIVSNTNVTYDQSQLLRIVYDHLLANKLHETASTLVREARISSLFSERSRSESLDGIVRQYLRNQHEQCLHPIAVLPPFSLLEPHRCPEPHTSVAAGHAPGCVSSRVMYRQTFGGHGGTGGRSADLHFQFSRFRPLRFLHDEEAEDPFICSACFLPDDHTQRLLAGTRTGEVKLFNVRTGDLVKTWQCHDGCVSRARLCPPKLCRPPAPLLLMTSKYEGSGPWMDASDMAQSETKLWNMRTMETMGTPLQVFQGVRAANFGSQSSENIVGTTRDGALLCSTETGAIVRTLNDLARRPDEVNDTHVASFSPDDQLVLDDNLLWDPRVPRLLHKFDKFSSCGSGYFNPRSGTDILVNSQVWDLRTFKLAKTCQQIPESASLEFSSLGDTAVMLTRAVADKAMWKASEPFEPSFQIVDMSDYSLVSTTHLDRRVWDVAMDLSDSHMVVIEEDRDAPDHQTFCRLYEIGRRRAAQGEGEEDEEEEEEEESDDEESDEEDIWGSSSGDEDDDDMSSSGGFSDEEWWSDGEDMSEVEGDVPVAVITFDQHGNPVEDEALRQHRAGPRAPAVEAAIAAAAAAIAAHPLAPAPAPPSVAQPQQPQPTVEEPPQQDQPAVQDQPAAQTQPQAARGARGRRGRARLVFRERRTEDDGGSGGGAPTGGAPAGSS